MAKTDNTHVKGWGGPWTEQKLDCFTRYVKAYLTIMNAYREKYHWKLLYFDGFAGCGDRKLQEDALDKTIDIFGDQNVDEMDINLYQGAAERVVRLEQEMAGFDFYYFIDKYEDNLTRLELKLAGYNTKGRKIFRANDANVETKNLAQAMKRDAETPQSVSHPYHLKTLCLLDPFGMSIDWETIEQLAGKSLDLWILVPTGSIISRLIKNDGSLMFPKTLERFFGLPQEQITERFYTKTYEPNLFGEETEKVVKTKNVIAEIANLYCEQLGTLFPYVTNEPLVLYNRNNVPIFHFVCASFNKTAVKIAQEIIDKK